MPTETAEPADAEVLSEIPGFDAAAAIRAAIESGPRRIWARIWIDFPCEVCSLVEGEAPLNDTKETALWLQLIGATPTGIASSDAPDGASLDRTFAIGIDAYTAHGWTLDSRTEAWLSKAVD